MRRFFAGFGYAAKGFWTAVKEERNLRFHLCAGAYVLLASLFYSFSAAEYALLFLCIGGVIALELICFLVEVIGGVTGTGIAWGFAVLIAVLTAACGRAAFKMQKVISRLEAEKNGMN